MAEPSVRGSFVWHELVTTDVPAAVEYYRKVVGWKTQPFDANYLMWVASGGPIGGVAKLPEGQTRPYWLPFIASTDIAATVQQAQQLGATVVTPVTEISNAGRYAVLTDPQGATFGVYWSANPMAPSSASQLGHYSWQELAVADYRAAFAFYEALFGWEKTGEHDMGSSGVYFMFGLNNQAFGGIYNKPADMPASWCCYAQVSDARKVAKVAVKAGGKVLNGPMQVPGDSWIAQIADPQGGMHAVVSCEAITAAAASATPATKTAALQKASKKKPSTKKAAKKKKATAKSKIARTPIRKVAKKTPVKKAVKKAKKVTRTLASKKTLSRKTTAPRKIKQRVKRQTVRNKTVARKKK